MSKIKTASEIKVNMVPFRFPSLSSFFAVAILKMPMMTKIKVIKTRTKKMKFTRVMRTLTTSPDGTPKNPKIGLSVEPKAKNAKRIPIKSKREQPKALMQPITNFLLDFDWSFGNAAVAAAGFCAAGGCAGCDVGAG